MNERRVVYPAHFNIKRSEPVASIDITIYLSLQHDTQLIVSELYFIFLHYSFPSCIHFLLSIYH